ncbi:MAG: hypothetical protein ABIH64_00330, partial [Nanoarchaeota archaeon]
MKFFERHRWPTFEGIMMILIVIISVFSFAFITADNKVSLFSGGNSITGNMVKVTGMDTMDKIPLLSNRYAIQKEDGTFELYDSSNKLLGNGVFVYSFNDGRYMIQPTKEGNQILYNSEDRQLAKGYYVSSYGDGKYIVQKTERGNLILYNSRDKKVADGFAVGVYDDGGYYVQSSSTSTPVFYNADGTPAPSGGTPAATLGTQPTALPGQATGNAITDIVYKPQDVPTGNIVKVDTNNDDIADHWAAKDNTGAIRLANQDGRWGTETYKFDYQFQARDSSGSTQTFIVSAATQAQAKAQLTSAGITQFTGGTVVTASPDASGNYETKQVGNRYVVTNGQQTRFAENQQSANAMAGTLNGIAQIKEEYAKQNSGRTISDALAAQVYLINNNNIVTRPALNTLGYTQITSASQTGGTTVQAPIKMEKAWIYKGQVINDDDVLAVTAMQQQYAKEVAQKKGLTSTGFYSDEMGTTEIFKKTDGTYVSIGENGNEQAHSADMFKQEKVGQDGKQTLITKYDKIGKLLSTYIKGHDSREVTPDEVQLIKDFKGTITVSGDNIILTKTDTSTNEETTITLTSGTNPTKKTEIKKGGRIISTETITIDLKGKQISKIKTTYYPDNSNPKTTLTVKADGSSLEINYDKTTSGKAASGKFTTADKKTVTLAKPEILSHIQDSNVEGNKDNPITMDMLALAQAYTASKSFFGWGDSNDGDWSFTANKFKVRNDAEVSLASAKIDIRSVTLIPKGTAYILGSDTVYVQSEGGYIYYNQNLATLKGASQFTLSMTREFLTDTPIGSGDHIITMRHGDYTRLDGGGDGTLIYRNGQLYGVLTENGDSAYKISDLYDEEGKWKGVGGDDPGVNFIK